MDAEFFLKPERAVQNRIIRLLQKYNGYEYIGNLKDTENTNIREDVLRKFLMERQELTSVQATEAIRKLKEVAICSNKEALYNSNKQQGCVQYSSLPCITKPGCLVFVTNRSNFVKVGSETLYNFYKLPNY